MLNGMEAVLARLGHSLRRAENGQKALEALDDSPADLVISDMKMPVMTGAELLRNIRERHPKTPVILCTAYGTIDQAVEAMKNGAFDFITKPFSAEDLEGAVERVFKARPMQRKSIAPSPRTAGRAIITNDTRFKKVLEIAATVAASDASVLLRGESGTGKELVARMIHSASKRAKGAFIAVNCAAVPANLLESELFGHEKGAFTGAVGTKIGKFEAADGGTILLDEISEMEEVLQAKLLRVLQEREIDRVGGAKPIPIDVRVIATTNRKIEESVKKGEFREDLFYRLNVIPLELPPLRDRSGDIRLLVEHFVREASDGKKSISKETLDTLEQYPWPGNVRELQNACERAVILAASDEVRTESFFFGSEQGEANLNTDELRLKPGLTVQEAEKRLIFETLKQTENNKTRAAELLGISIRTLRNKLNEYRAQEEAVAGESA